MDKEKSIEALNTLIEIHNNRISGYQSAFKEAEEPDLKTMFTQFAQLSQRFKHELIYEVHKLCGIAIEKNKNSGKLFKIWSEVKIALNNKDRKSILLNCKIGEELAVDTYKNVLKNTDDSLSSELIKLLAEHLSALKADHHKVDTMLKQLTVQNLQLHH